MESSKKNNKGKMKIVCLKQIEKDRIKIKKIEDYYELFVKMLKTEHKDLQTHEHLWVLGIDKMGYSVCLYIVSLGCSNFPTVHPMKIFKFALQANAVKIVIAQSKPNDSKFEMNADDLDLTNAIYHKSALLELELVDHIIISNLSIDSSEPLYYSYIEHGLIEFVSKDITYKAVKEVEEELEKEKDEVMKYGISRGKSIGKRERNIEIAKKMLLKDKPVKEILEFTGLGLEDIEDIKKKMGK